MQIADKIAEIYLAVLLLAVVLVGSTFLTDLVLNKIIEFCEKSRKAKIDKD